MFRANSPLSDKFGRIAMHLTLAEARRRWAAYLQDNP